MTQKLLIGECVMSWAEKVIEEVLYNLYGGFMSESLACTILQCDYTKLDSLMRTNYGKSWRETYSINRSIELYGDD
jgi:hypothetical protein